MKIDFVRFKATDDVELQGWLSHKDSDTAVIHIHGRSGNGYENYFLDNLREMYSQQNISMFTIDTRGRGIISDFRKGNGWLHAGSCFEIFDDCVYDIEGAIRYLKTIGKTKFILQGHSLGCTKIIHYLITKGEKDIIKVISLAPTDMVGWAQTDPIHNEYLEKSERLLSNGKGQELVGSQCWLDLSPLSAQTYPTLCKKGGAADIYGERVSKALLGKVELPMLIAYGDQDIGILEIDKTMTNWESRVNKIKNPNTEIVVIAGAEHGFRGFEQILTNTVRSFLTK